MQLASFKGGTWKESEDIVSPSRDFYSMQMPVKFHVFAELNLR